jgi:putative tributyrin esterase
MALFQCNFHSAALGQAMSLNAILPDSPGPHPVLFLLHGRSDDHSIWLRRTSVERYASERGIAVIMPAAHRGFYTNMVHGYPYFDYIADEIPALCDQWFPLATDRAHRWIAGLSMGGYGALKVALTHPGRWSAAASMSGAIDPNFALSPRGDPLADAEGRLIFGAVDDLQHTAHDPLHLLTAAHAAGHPLPRLRLSCGTEDFLYPAHRRFCDACAARGIALTTDSGPGDHNWAYWDQQIIAVLDWLLTPPPPPIRK